MTSIDKEPWLYPCPDLRCQTTSEMQEVEAAWVSFRRRINDLERELAEVEGELMDLAPGGANACIDWRDAVESIHRAMIMEAAETSRALCPVPLRTVPAPAGENKEI